MGSLKGMYIGLTPCRKRGGVISAAPVGGVICAVSGAKLSVDAGDAKASGSKDREELGRMPGRGPLGTDDICNSGIDGSTPSGLYFRGIS